MNWQDVFVGVVALAVIIRLLFIGFGSMSGEEIVSKAFYWIAGLVLLGLAWGTLNIFFGGGAGRLFKVGGAGAESTSKSTIFDENKRTKKNNSSANESSTINININRDDVRE